jgi:predicted NBD/HSP70 family sugar kinase
MILAVDVGGTKTLVASFRDERRVEAEERFPTPDDPQEFLRELHITLKRFDLSSLTAICVAVPGIISPDGVVLRCGNLPWTNFPLQKLLRESFACPVLINNDAKLAGLAETHSLEEIPPLSVYVTISTGIGTGIITNGRLDPALSQSEGGYMMLQRSEGLHPWEKFASGRAIHEQFGRLARDIHETNDWHKIVEELVPGFLALIPLLQPDIIIIGGSVGRYFDRFGHLLQETLRHAMPAYIDLPPIVQAKHPDEAVVYGCYYYASHHLTS